MRVPGKSNKKDMNSNKVLYWNRLRLQLNTCVLIICVITLFIKFIFPEIEFFTTSYLRFKLPTIVIAALVELIIYISLVNFVILILEVIDRMIYFEEQEIIKKCFKFITFIIFLSFPLLNIIILSWVRFYKSLIRIL